MESSRQFSPESPKARASVFLVTALLAAAMIGLAFWKTLSEGHAALGAQAADKPLETSASVAPDFRFSLPSAWEMAAVPAAIRFDPPLGSEHAALAVRTENFAQPNEERGGLHTGEDWNGIGGGNTGLGDPVFAVADGLVTFAGEPSPSWGKIVAIAHRTADGSIIQSFYAHLGRLETTVGALVARGSRIGTVGTANGHYPAHLHFEIRDGMGTDIGSGYAAETLNRLDPSGTLEKLRNAAADDLAPSPLGVPAGGS